MEPVIFPKLSIRSCGVAGTALAQLLAQYPVDTQHPLFRIEQLTTPASVKARASGVVFQNSWEPFAAEVEVFDPDCIGSMDARDPRFGSPPLEEPLSTLLLTSVSWRAGTDSESLHPLTQAEIEQFISADLREQVEILPADKPVGAWAVLCDQSGKCHELHLVRETSLTERILQWKRFQTSGFLDPLNFQGMDQYHFQYLRALLCFTPSVDPANPNKLKPF